MKEDQLNKTIETIRNLPAEVEWKDIQKFILSQPIAIYTSTKFSWLNFKNIIIMVTSGSIISLILMLNSGNPTQPVIAKNGVTKLSAKKETLVEKSIQLPLPTLELKTPVEIRKESINLSPAPALEKTVFDSSVKEPEISLLPSIQKIPDPEQPAPPACKTPCNCKCDDADNVACTFKERLIEDELITDNDKYSFKIDDKSLTVNGQTQPDNLYRKYSKIYREQTGRKLTQGTYISVSVEKGNCTISTSTNDGSESESSNQ